MPHRRSPTGEIVNLLLPEDEGTSIATTGGTITLGAGRSQWRVFTGTLTSALTIELPASPKDGDAVFVKALVAGAFDVQIDGNGNNLDGQGSAVVLGQGATSNPGAYVQFSAAQNSWLICWSTAL